MKIFLGINKAPPLLERSFQAATKLKGELPTDIEMESIPPMELLSIVEVFMLRHKKHRKILTLICENF